MGETLEINMKISHNQQDEDLSTQRIQGLVKDDSSNFDAISKLAFSFDNLKPYFVNMTKSYLKISFSINRYALITTKQMHMRALDSYHM